MTHLRNDAEARHIGAVLSRHGMKAVLIDGGDGVALIVTGRHDLHPGAVTGITGMGSDDRAIGARLLAHHDAGA